MQDEKKYEKLFVGGDLSGIQKFLYNISSKEAAVSLIGRSDYLRSYMDDVCSNLMKTINQAGATTTVKRYCSGGKFYLTTDNTEAIRKAISTFAENTKRALWEEHRGQLGIHIAFVAFDENTDDTVNVSDKQDERPGILWKILGDEFALQKAQKFRDVLRDDYSTLFEPIPIGGKTLVCAVTGIESDDCVKIATEEEEEEKEIYVLPSVKKQIEIGRELRAKYRFKTFAEYAKDTLLGILRMDVDGLGKRFSDGFGSINDYQAFSERLVEFFEGEVKTIRRESDFRDYLNIIYAGGDDLFIVGRWDKVIDFAERIHDEVTRRFSADGITISGGTVAVKPKFPISKAAEMAGDAEHAAKQYGNGKKNAFNLFGKTVSWEDFKKVKKYKEEFCLYIDDENENALSKGILHKIMLYASIAEANKEHELKGEAKDFSYVWHMTYYLTRLMGRIKEKNRDAWDFCRKLRDEELSRDNLQNLELMAIAARWAELKIRYKL